MTASIKKIEISAIRSLSVPVPTRVSAQIHRMIEIHLRENTIAALLALILPVRIFQIREHLFLIDHYCLLVELQKLLPKLELDFIVVKKVASTSLSDLQTLIINRLEIDALCSMDPKDLQSLSSSEQCAKPILRQYQYAHVLGCSPSTLKKRKKRLNSFSQTAEPEDDAIDIDGLLHDVPELEDQE